MTEILLDAVLDAIIDTAKLIPFLLVTYLLMEWLERRMEDHSTEALQRVGRFGPLVGAAVGIVPQCGFSAAAASLYAGGVISIGTLLAAFWSTSDEMLPILISSRVAPVTILRILGTKLVLAAICGLALDAILVRTRYRHKVVKHIHDLCEQEHCGCEEEEEGSILHSAIVHTVHITVFVFLITLILTILVEGFGQETITHVLTGHPMIGILLSALVGLIPNCASSVSITQLYVGGMLGAGEMMAGLFVNAGVGLLVLFRTNRHLSENLKITALLYAGGVACGLLISLCGITF